jgi:hypothetical protein
MTDFAAAASTAKRKKALEARLNGLKVAKSARQRAAAVRRCKVRKRAGLGVLRFEAPLGPLADRLAEDGFIGEWDFTPARFQSYADAEKFERNRCAICTNSIRWRLGVRVKRNMPFALRQCLHLTQSGQWPASPEAYPLMCDTMSCR